MERVITGFNGLHELLKRNDAGLELYAIYKTMNPHNFGKNWSNLKKGRFAAEFAKIEILMAQKTILSSFKQNERFLLLQESVEKQKAMLLYPMYDRRNQEPNVYLNNARGLFGFDQPI